MLMWPGPLGLMLNLVTLRDISKMRRSQVGPFNMFILEEISTSLPLDLGLIRLQSNSKTFSEAAFEPKSADFKAGATKLSGVVIKSQWGGAGSWIRPVISWESSQSHSSLLLLCWLATILKH